MLKIVCDRCGKEVSTRNIEAIKYAQRFTIGHIDYDLCEECKAKVKEFIVNNEQTEPSTEESSTVERIE